MRMQQNDDPFSDLIRSLEQNLQRGEDWVPPDDDAPSTPRGNPRRFLWFLIPLLIFVFFNQIIGFIADWFWYGSVELTSVLITRIVARLSLFLAGALLFWFMVALNVLIARRLSPNGLAGTPLEQTVNAFGLRVTPAVLVIAGIVAFFVGVSTAAAWEAVLLYLNQSAFGIADPVFDRDVGFFVFTLPIWQIASLLAAVHADRVPRGRHGGERHRLERMECAHARACPPGCAGILDPGAFRVAVSNQRFPTGVQFAWGRFWGRLRG